MSDALIGPIKKRRSIYTIGKRKVISEEKIEKIVSTLIQYVPSAYNSQSSRVVLLFGGESSKFWNITKETLRKIVPADSFEKTEKKLAGFDSGYGTILFFEDQKTVNDLMTNFPLFKDNFPLWSCQSVGMLQFAVWTALEAEGLGASLQHYNPLVDDAVKKEWKLPEDWRLFAEMPFGSVEGPAGPKDFLPIETRFKVFR
ncbi:nitroreductase family protein [Brucepastera parasyntrophica]|uniref:nitroreductase family protein n=1 Tax=Brucepastera parasyntrophica TaxID=2880008 RepID=UPI00210D5EE1|nr:nitroreductase family protein [Brucepastera parasyntrophica]ULQ59341.1 nitroreductase family protein [Brucepastera parasyntrophica]